MGNFEKSILEDIEERTLLLFEIEKIIFTKRYKMNRKHINILSVQSISMMYSIWEGFIQKNFQLYIKQLNQLEISFDELNDVLKVFHIENTFKQFGQYPEKITKKIQFYKTLKDFFTDNVHLLYDKINTQNNVNFNILNTILESFALEIFPETWQEYKHPEPNLKEMLKSFIRYRNGVAHGGDISSEEIITQKVYSKYKKLITDLMYGIYEKMLQGLELKTYLQKI